MQGVENNYQPSFWQGFTAKLQQFFDNAKFQVGEFFTGLAAQVKGLFADKSSQAYRESTTGLAQGDFSGLSDQSQGEPVFLQEKGGSSGELENSFGEQTQGHFLDSLESGQSIFDPMVIDQMNGSREIRAEVVETTSVEINQQDQVIMPTFLQPQQIGAEVDVRETSQQPIMEGRMVDTVVRSEYEVSSGVISDEELQLVQAQQPLLLAPGQSDASIMPGQNWEAVKPEVKPQGIKQPTLIDKGKDLIVPDAGAMDFQPKSDLVDFLSTKQFYMEPAKGPGGEVIPGQWDKVYDVATTQEFEAGIKLGIPSGTKLTVAYIKDDIYEFRTSQPIDFKWGLEQPIATFTKVQVAFNYEEMNLRLVKGGNDFKAAMGTLVDLFITKAGEFLMKEGGWDVR